MATTAFDYLLKASRYTYSDARERQAVVRLILEDELGLQGAAVYTREVNDLSDNDRTLLGQLAEKLRAGQPLQYALGWAWFGGRKYEVGPGVLIPRPETEDVVAATTALARRWKADAPDASLLLVDACTGSGCMAISASLSLKDAFQQPDGLRAEAFDISADALSYARKNGTNLHADVAFHEADLLGLADKAVALPSYLLPRARERSLWLCNPPYIHPNEADEMEDHVLSWEPNEALFAPINAPVFYYEAVARAARRAKADAVVCEINPLFEIGTCEAFRAEGYAQITVELDRFGRRRILTAEK